MGQSFAGVARMQQTILNSAQDRCQTPTSTHTRRRRALNFIYFGDANLPLSSPSRSELISFMFHLDRHQHHGSIHYASNQPSPSDHLSFILPASGAFRPHRATHDPSDSSLTPACLKRVRCAARRCLQLELPSKLTSSALPFSDTRRVLLPTPPPPPPPHLTPRHRCVVSVCLRVTRAARQRTEAPRAHARGASSCS